jgi:hypothetical protein
MTADVRIEVKNYEVVSTTMEDESLFVVGRVFYGTTKDTGIGRRHVGSSRRDIGVSPGTPESFHKKP